MNKMHILGKREANSGIKLLGYLFWSPIVTSATVAKALSFTRVGAQKAIDRFIDLWILVPYSDSETYGKRYKYQNYLAIFNM
jgi:hypothetical protein